MLSVKVISHISKLTRSERVKVFVIDDSLVPRERSKKLNCQPVFLIIPVVNSIKDLQCLLLDGLMDTALYLLIFQCFHLLTKKQLHEVSDSIDKRTMVINADYVLMDTWFTHEPFIKSILKEGLDVIGMVKQLKQKYEYNNHLYTLKELRKFISKTSISNMLGSLNVKTKNDLKVKLLYVKNRNKKNDWLVVFSTDLTISTDEIIHIYGIYWFIEVFFKSIKSFVKLGKEF